MNLASANAEVRQKSQDRLHTEIMTASALGVRTLVIHLGANQSRELGEQLAIESLKAAVTLAERNNVQILIENTAGQGNALGLTGSELNAILQEFDQGAPIGLCLDTCHLFAAGYELRGYKGYTNTMTQLESEMDLNRVGVIHINDSKHPLGSRRDRHASIGRGQIGIQFFHAITRDDRFASIPKITELEPALARESLETLRKLRETVALTL